MWRSVLVVLLILLSAGPLLASDGHGDGGNPALGVFLKGLNIAAFFGLLIYLMARPLRGFFEKHTEGIRSAIDGSLEKEREALELDGRARALAASVDAEVEALRRRFAAERERMKEDLNAALDRSMARLQADHRRSLAQLEEAFRADLVGQTLRAARDEAMRSLQTDLAPADRIRFLDSVTGSDQA